MLLWEHTQIQVMHKIWYMIFSLIEYLSVIWSIKSIKFTLQWWK